MTYSTYVVRAQTRLRNHGFPINTIFTLIFHFHPTVRTLGQFTDYMNDEIDPSILQQLEESLDKLIIEHWPLGYVIGHVWFLGTQYAVNPNVLIPRVETEYWVDKLIDTLDEYGPLDILDMCCGSGVIGLAIKKQLSRMHVTLTDISDDAITNTTANALTYDLPVNIIKSDLFTNLSNTKFDVIICNPPYVDEIAKLDESVSKYEPHLALFAPQQGLGFYQLILSQINTYLNEKYLIVFEIGNTQAKDVLALIQKHLHVDGTVWKDQFNRDRAIIVRRE